LKRKHKKTDYAKLKRKFYLYILAIVAAASGFVLFLRSLTRGHVGDRIVAFLERVFYFSRRDALRIYQNVVRNNLEILIFAAIIVCILVLFRFALSKFAGYFDEVSSGIDMLIRDEDGEIGLPPELEFMERKLDALKRTLEKRERDAKQAEQRKNDVVMYLAHDIKTPLTSVIGYLSLLDEAPDMPPGQRSRYVHITLDKAYRLDRLIDEFFEITRYNLQTISLDKTNIDLHYMLAQMADEFYPRLAADGKRAVVRAPEDLTVHGDPGKLARVFNNILKNAAAYSEAGSVIDISAGIEGNTATVTFKNSGGIPKDKLDAIFEKFYRLDGARSSGTGGSGLGLAIAKEIVDRHGGRIYAESDGVSTSFTVELPAAPGPAGQTGVS
jgi:two-component system sensor histidine kinase VanS